MTVKMMLIRSDLSVGSDCIFRILITITFVSFLVSHIDCDPTDRPPLQHQRLSPNTSSELPSRDRPAPVQGHGVLYDVWNSLTQTAKAPSCPGECIHAITSLFCDRVLEGEFSCGQEQLRCCVTFDIYNNLTLHPELATNSVNTFTSPLPTTMTASASTNSFRNYPASSPFTSPAAAKATTSSASISTSTSTTTTTTTTTTTPAPATFPPLEDCNGTCYNPLFSLLCEEADDTKYCSNGGTCCIVREPTTTPAPPPTCDGNCIPLFFSGAFCNRPAELIPKTVDCMPGTICCAEREKGSADSDPGEEPEANNDANVDMEEEVPLLNHPPPQINRPVPKPLHPPQIMFTQQRPFSTLPIHSYPQPGMFPQMRPNRPPDHYHQGPVRKPSFSLPPSGMHQQPQHQNYQPPPQSIQHNGLMMNGNEMVRGQSAPGPVIVDPPPMCTGVCITPLLKFTCFGSNVLYQNFACQSPEEVCCVSISEVQSYEASLIKNTAHFIDMKPVMPQTPVIPNFIATKGQALGPHLQQQPQQHHGQQVPVQQHPLQHHGQPIPRPQQPQPVHHTPKPQMQPHPHMRPVNTNNNLVVQSIAPQVVASIKVPSGAQQIHSSPVRNTIVHQSSPVSTAGNTRIESIPPHVQKVIASVSSPVSSATPSIVIHQTQNLPPTESTMSLNSSSLTAVTVNPQSPAVTGSASFSNTTLSSIASIITSITTSSPPPLPASSLDPELQPTTAAQSTRRTSPLTCGMKGIDRPETPRIVGGRDALPGEWCWQVALVNSQNQYLCGGALIGTQWVLTAAHCITNMVRNSEEIFIRVGDFDLQNPKSSPNAQTVKSSTTYIHHNHNGQTLDNDIALLRMETPVDVNESVCLVCLPTRGSTRKPGKFCHVSGYGYTSEVGPMSLKVRSAKVPIVEDQHCTSKINTVTEKLFILPASSFCAGGSDGSDACQGDGGGPLVCESDGFYEITGLVSWGFGCGRPDVPAVYVKVSSFIGWINQIISVNNQ